MEKDCALTSVNMSLNFWHRAARTARSSTGSDNTARLLIAQFSSPLTPRQGISTQRLLMAQIYSLNSSLYPYNCPVFKDFKRPLFREAFTPAGSNSLQSQ